MQMSADSLSQTFAALADPTRRAILARLCAWEATVSALAQPFDFTLPAVFQPLMVLEPPVPLIRRLQPPLPPCLLFPPPLYPSPACLAPLPPFSYPPPPPLSAPPPL